MEYFIKFENSFYNVNVSVVNILLNNKFDFSKTHQGKKIIFFLNDFTISFFQVVKTTSLTHFYILLFYKKCRVSKKFFMFLKSHFDKKNNLFSEPRQNVNKKKQFIELCAGAGGFSTGFISNGFEALLLNDNDKQCIETLKLNHSGTPIFFGNMEDLELKSYYKKVDVLVAGLPCQSFSQIGNRKGVDDPRGSLVFHFIQIVKFLEPKVFVIENVPGLLSLKKGQTLKMITKKLEDLHLYKLYIKVLNANDYGVAQNRKRLFIVGIKNTITKVFKFPKQQDYKPILADVLLNCPESVGCTYNNATYELLKKIPEGGCWTHLSEDKQKEYLGNSFFSSGGKRGILRRLSMKKPSLTLLANPVQKQTQRCHPIATRPLQILEYARIQSFADSYKFCGSAQQIYKQIGNAVPPKLAKALAKEIMVVLS